MSLTVRAYDDSPYYATVRVMPDGAVGVQLCRRILWSGPKFGTGCNRPHPMNRLIHAIKLDAPMHVVLDHVHTMLKELET